MGKMICAGVTSFGLLVAAAHGAVSTSPSESVMVQNREAGVRSGVGKPSGSGSQETEAAVLMALRWLKATQQPDGSWTTQPKYGLKKDMDKAAGAGFAVLTFLAHNETPASREFGSTVQKALDYLVNSVYVEKYKDGTLKEDCNGNTPSVKMRGALGAEYGFLIATYALCEAYGMTEYPNVRTAAEQCLARIVRGQNSTGGWNYNMKCTPDVGGSDDISFGGWAMQALKAGKMAGIDVPGLDECIKKAVVCLKKRNYSKKAGFAYRAITNHNDGGGGLGGVGCLAMMLFGHGKDREVVNALYVMKDWLPTLDARHVTGGENSQYYSYYATRCKYMAGMRKGATTENVKRWKKWDARMKELYPKTIITVKDAAGEVITVKDGMGRDCPMGRWQNKDHYTYDVMGTCLVALQLMVSYNHLPTMSLKACEVTGN